MAVQVLFVDDRPMLRAGMGAVLPGLNGSEITRECDSIEAAIDELDRGSVDVIVLGRIADTSGGEDPIALLRRHHPGVPCVYLADCNARGILERCLSGEVQAYVVPTDEARDLAEAIAVAREGRSYVSRGASHHLAHALHGSGARAAVEEHGLTPREQDVLRGVADGRSCSGIASALGISTRTVEHHRSNLMAKLGIHKCASLVRFAVREGLVEA